MKQISQSSETLLNKSSWSGIKNHPEFKSHGMFDKFYILQSYQKHVLKSQKGCVLKLKTDIKKLRLQTNISPAHTVLLTGESMKMTSLHQRWQISTPLFLHTKITFHVSSCSPRRVSSPSVSRFNIVLTSWKCRLRALRSQLQRSQSLLGLNRWLQSVQTPAGSSETSGRWQSNIRVQ